MVNWGAPPGIHRIWFRVPSNQTKPSGQTFMSISSAVTIALAPEVKSGPFVLHADIAGLDPLFERLRTLGFPGVEIFPRTPEDIDPGFLKPLLEKHGLRLAAVGTGAGWVIHKLRLSDPDATQRTKAVEFVRDLIRRAAVLGAPVIIGSMQGKSDPDGKEATMSRLRESVGALAREAGALGQKLLLEPLNRYESDLLNRVGDVCALADHLGEKSISVLADLFHMNIEEVDIARALLDCGAQLGHVHLADSNRLAAGFGHTPMAPIFAALKSIGYNGFVSAEVFPRPDPDAAMMATLRTWFELA